MGANSSILLIDRMKQRWFTLFFSLTIFMSTPQTDADFFAQFSAIGENPFLNDENAGTEAFNVLRIPLGGIGEAMGTAYTAVLLDSGFIEYNPAGSSVLKFTELSLHHTYYIARSNLEGVVYTLRFNDLGIGFGGKFLYTDFNRYGDFSETLASTYISETLGTLNVSYNFFNSYSFFGLAVGANVKVAYRNIPAEVYSAVGSYPEVAAGDQSVIVPMADLGILTRFDLLKFYTSRSKNFSLGAVVKNLGPPAQLDPLPSEFTAGFSYSPIKPILVSFDATLPFNFDPDLPSRAFSVAAGLNVNVTPFLAVQTGFRIVGSNPRFSIGSTLTVNSLTFNLGYVLDLTSNNANDPFSNFRIEAKLNLGDFGRADTQKRVDELYALGLESFALGDYRKAVEYWEELLHLDPHFDIVVAMLETARQKIEIEDKLRELSTFE